MQSHLIVMKSRFEGKCTKCVYPIWKGAWMVYNLNKKTAKHKKCPYTKERHRGRVRLVS